MILLLPSFSTQSNGRPAGSARRCRRLTRLPNCHSKLISRLKKLNLALSFELPSSLPYRHRAEQLKRTEATKCGFVSRQQPTKLTTSSGFQLGSSSIRVCRQSPSNVTLSCLRPPFHDDQRDSDEYPSARPTAFFIAMSTADMHPPTPKVPESGRRTRGHPSFPLPPFFRSEEASSSDTRKQATTTTTTTAAAATDLSLS